MINFKYLKKDKLLVLIDIVSNSSVSIDFLEARYRERADLYFFQNYQFLYTIGILTVEDSNVSLSFSDKNSSHIENINYAIFKSENAYQANILNFFKHFIKINNDYVLEKISSREIFIRNFLFSLGIVNNQNQNIYGLNPKFIHLIPKKSSKYSLKEFEDDQEKRKIVGVNAEKAVLKYENERLKKLSDKDLIAKRLSDEDVSLGYDIVSYSISDGQISRRFIEVKAVSQNKLDFFWSRGEIKTANEYRDKYFLYLIPAISNNKFDFTNLTVIQNPYLSVFMDENNWGKEIQGYKFNQKIHNK